MKIYVNTELRFGGRSGVEARSPDLRLTSHGVDEHEALKSLEQGILAWCYGLKSRGKLERVLSRKQIKVEENGENIGLEFNHRK